MTRGRWSRRNGAETCWPKGPTDWSASTGPQTEKAGFKSTPKGHGRSRNFSGSWAPDSRLYVHRRENPLPAWRAESDVFEGRLLRFADLSFEDAIRAYFAGHVSATHFFAPDDVRRVVAAGADHPVTLRDLTGDTVTLGPNDILAIDLRHEGEVEVALPSERFRDPEAARAALLARGAHVTRPGRLATDRQTWIVAVGASDRDHVLDGIGDIDPHVDIHDVRETVKVRLADLAVQQSDGLLVIRGGVVGVGENGGTPCSRQHRDHPDAGDGADPT